LRPQSPPAHRNAFNESIAAGRPRLRDPAWLTTTGRTTSIASFCSRAIAAMRPERRSRTPTAAHRLAWSEVRLYFLSELCHLPRTLGQHRHLRGHIDADGCCGKPFIGVRLCDLGASARARNRFPSALLHPPQAHTVPSARTRNYAKFGGELEESRPTAAAGIGPLRIARSCSLARLSRFCPGGKVARCTGRFPQLVAAGPGSPRKGMKILAWAQWRRWERRGRD
jgi:hypothetical protein